MTLTQAISVAFLTVSLLSLAIQSWALHRLRIEHIRGGVFRTVWFRVICAVLYVLVGVNALWEHWVTLQISLLAFFITQAIWVTNTVVDVKHGRRPPYHPRHRLNHPFMGDSAILRPNGSSYPQINKEGYSIPHGYRRTGYSG